MLRRCLGDVEEMLRDHLNHERHEKHENCQMKNFVFLVFFVVKNKICSIQICTQ